VRPDWIQDDVAGQFQSIVFFLHQDGFVAALQYLPDKVMASVEILGINAIQLAHTLGQIRIDRLNEWVIMIAHLAKTVHDKMISFTRQCQYFLPSKAIGIIPTNSATPVAARSNVVKGTGELKSKWSGHAVDGT